MKPSERTLRGNVWTRRVVAAALLLALPLAASLVRGQKEIGPDKGKDPEKKGESPAKKADHPAPPPGAVEVQLMDGSTMKLALRDERLELNTPYGKLLIPVADVQRIEFAFRLPDDVARRIETAVADLGKTDFHRREAATAELMELRERAYPALLKAEKSPDMEVARRARELLERIRDEVPAEHLEFRPHDVVYTEGSKNTGRIAQAVLRVNTFPFGEQQLKLADVRELRSQSAAEPEPANVLADPGNLNMYMGQVGAKPLAFRVTGVPQAGAAPGGPGLAPGMIVGGQAFIWGTDVYTLDSSLALAAVHAGVLKPGQTGVVRVRILGPQAAFGASTRNGVTSMAYGVYNGAFEFVRGRARPER
jgi:hypothetical protein